MSNGIKLQAALFAAALLLAVAALLLFWQFLRNETAITAAENSRFQTYQIADGLRHTSDDLTRMARLYAVTGEARYQDYFQEILDIRSGDAPRPDQYFRVYWDFVVDSGQRPRTAHRALPLDELARQAGFTEREFKLLRQSEDNSNLLAQLEQQALQAQTPAELEQARQILHGPQYHAEKARIMTPLNHLLAAADNRASQTLNTRLSARQTYSIVILLLLALSGLLSAAGLVAAIKGGRG